MTFYVRTWYEDIIFGEVSLMPQSVLITYNDRTFDTYIEALGYLNFIMKKYHKEDKDLSFCQIIKMRKEYT